MSLLKILKEYESQNIKVIQSFESEECNEYEFFDKNNRKFLYINEYFYSPIDNEKLDHTVYELYYDNDNMTNNHENDDFLGSSVYDDLEYFLSEFEEYI